MRLTMITMITTISTLTSLLAPAASFSLHQDLQLGLAAVEDVGRSLLTMTRRSNMESLSAFLSFMRAHNNTYSDQAEYKRRYRVFRSNMRLVEKLQAEERGSAVYGATHLADLSQEEEAATTRFLENVNKWRASREMKDLSWASAVKFLMARKFNVERALVLYQQHEIMR